jgi:hypothetical protein
MYSQTFKSQTPPQLYIDFTENPLKPLGIVNAICCFFIVKKNPISIWYVPLIINVIYIISAVVESMKTSAWVAICGILALSLIASIIGARMGRRETVS